MTDDPPSRPRARYINQVDVRIERQLMRNKAEWERFKKMRQLTRIYLDAFRAEASDLDAGESMSSPTSSLTWLLDVVLPPKAAADALANLEEVYPIWQSRYGDRGAQRILNIQLLRVVLGHVVSRLLSYAEKIGAVIRPS